MAKTKQKEEEERLKKEKVKKELEEIKEKEQQIAKQSEAYLWLKALFGGLLLVGSSFSIYLLYRYKKHFLKSK